MRPPAAAPVDAYRNLSRSCFSVRRAGRVIGHVETLVLKDARFVVSAAGVRRVQTRRAREVVAVVRGAPSNPEPSRARRCGFASAPTGAHFTLGDGTPVRAAALVHLAADGSCWAVDPT